MINVNQITSMLAKMPDTSLQQYAAMHKNDPYIMALAVSESNRRKEMRASAQAPMGAQEQPKVVDQAVQGMAEDQGIAALPAGDMNFADGGIVAFAGGGVTEADVRKAYDNWMNSKPSWYQQATPLSGRNEAAAEAEYTRLLSEFQKQSGTPAAMPQAPITQAGTPPMPNAAAAADGSTAEKDKQTLPPGIGASRTGGFSDYASAKAGLADLYKTPDLSEYEAARKAQAGAGVGVAQEAAGRTQEFYDKLGEFGLKQEERLKEREGKLEKDTAQNKGLAIFELGLRAMAGTSANAFENLGNAGIGAVASYKKGLVALNDRKDRLDDAYNQLETARYSDKKDRFQQMEAAQKNVDAAKLGIYQATTDIAAKKTDLSAQQAKALADATVKSVEAQRDRQSREAVAGASSPLAMYKVLGDGDAKQGMILAKQIEAGKFSVQDAYSKYLTAFAGKETLTKPMDFTTFASQFSISAPPAGSQILKPKS